ncbi:hypothetical protein [Pseudomarimonas arenosa]|uniref:Tail specific protease domain-containing protein n=1 Tax=Pseudomarimonas arenosa TaxID=2774145 RepID=A0AAW3ZHQ0_9GAMM|nr:hypothetical protein [Pseudomarimonas arenosa]MBD8524652.1 hypothetical protein [Pseudomarimonas arenosa]
MQLSPDRGEYWYRLGRARQELGEVGPAIQALHRALAHGYATAQTRKRLAELEAQRGDAEAAVAEFEAARAAKLVNAEQVLMSSPPLSALLKDPRWQARIWPQLPAEANRLSRWHTDLDFLDKRMRETHWQLFSQVSEADWTAAIERLRSDLPALSDWQVNVRLMELVRLGRAGHTHMLPPFQGDAFHAADLRLGWFADGLFVTAAPTEHSALVGRQVLRIGNGEPEAVLAKLRAVVPHDSESGLLTFSPIYLLIPELLMHYGFADARDQLEFTLSGSGGRAERIRLPAPALSIQRLQSWMMHVEAPADWVLARDRHASARWLRHVDQPFWLDRTPQQGLLYAQLNAVRDGDQESLADFAERLNQTLRSDKVDALVLDLRLNRGGNGELLELLVQALIASPKLHQPGGLYVLISGRSFSATSLLIGDLERQLDPIFVGEPSGAGPTHVGEDNMILLPNTGIAVMAASRHFVRSFSDDQRDSMAPHIAAALRFADYRDNRDPAWDAVRADRVPR